MQPSELTRTQWHRGQLLAFSGLDGPTDYEEGLVARTIDSPPGLEIKYPVECRIDFECTISGEVAFYGDCFRFVSAGEEVRGCLLDAHHLLIGTACRVNQVPAGLKVITRGNRTLIGAASHFDAARIDADPDSAWAARTAWLSGQNFEPDSPQGKRTLQRALSLMKTQVCSPEGLLQRRWTTPDRWPHKDMWLWDSAFHAIGWRHVDPALAMEMIEAVFDGQRADGFIPLRASPLKTEPVMTQPPVLAYGAKKVVEITGDWNWIARLFPKLCAYVEWDLANRDSDGAGLAEWFIEEHPTCRSGESGMDNSPRFDGALQLDAVDFNAFLANECEVLSGFARHLGNPVAEKRWGHAHRELCRIINERLWSPEHHFYCDLDPATEKHTPVFSSAGFLPLLCGAASEDQALWLGRHLDDPEMFKTNFPVASIAVRNRDFYAKDMWRGPSWININWLIAEGFARYGMEAQAEAIRTSTRREIERCVEKFGVFFEYFDDRGEVEPPELLRKGVCAPEESPYHQVIHDFGWTAALYVDLLAR